MCSAIMKRDEHALVWQVYCKHILISHTCTKFIGPMPEQNCCIKTFSQWSQSCTCMLYIWAGTLPSLLLQGTQIASDHEDCDVQSGPQDGESNQQLDFIGSIQTVKVCLEREEHNVAKKGQKNMPKIWELEFQKQLWSSPAQGGTENKTWDSVF